MLSESNRTNYLNTNITMVIKQDVIQSNKHLLCRENRSDIDDNDNYDTNLKQVRNNDKTRTGKHDVLESPPHLCKVPIRLNEQNIKRKYS